MLLIIFLISTLLSSIGFGETGAIYNFDTKAVPEIQWLY